MDSMENKNTFKLIKINWMLYTYIHYIFAVWCCDAVDIVALEVNMKQGTIFSRVFVAVLVIILFKFDIKYFDIQRMKLTLTDIVAVGGLFLLSLYMCIYPDVSYDVVCYHAINQEPIWGKNVGYFREIYSPLADRLFYIFRFILGYRLGTLFNMVIYVITYFQCKKIFSVLLPKEGQNTPFYRKPDFFSILCLALEAGLMDLGTYMSDMVGVPIVLEALYILLEESDDKEKNYFSEMLYYVILLTFLFLFKVSSAIYILPLLVIYLWKRRKQLNVLRFLLCLITGILFLVPSMIYNIKLTGTPLYELSGLLGSAAAGNGMGDVRWGGQTFIEKIIWPFYMAFFPHYRHMELIDMPNVYPLTAFVAVLLIGWKSIRKKGWILFGIFVIPFYLWVVMGGVDRYILAGVICAGIFICYVSQQLINKGKKIRGYVLLGICMFQCIASFCGIFIYNNNWQCAPSVLNQIRTGNMAFIQEIKYWGRDRGELIPDGNKYQHFIVPERPYAGLASAVNDDAEILEVYFPIYGSEWSADFINTRLESLKKENMPVYSICMSKDTLTLIQLLSQYGLQVVNIETYEETYLGSVSILQLSIGKGENEICTAGKDEYVELGTIEQAGMHNIRSIIMIEPFVTWTKNPIGVSIYIDDGVDEKLLDTIEVVPGNPIVYDKVLNIEQSGKIIVKTDGNYSIDADVVCFVNLNIE